MNKTTISRTLFWLSLSLLIVAAIVHFSAVAGFSFSSFFPPIMLLHLLVFVVFIPAVIFQSLNNRAKKTNNLLMTLPTMVKFVGGALMLYTMFNFFWAGGHLPGSPQIKDGQYIMANRGQLIAVLTEAEYLRAQTWQLQMFSGHWLMFFAAATFFHWQTWKSPDSSQIQ